MTKTERIQLIRTYFNEVARIDGNVPCIQWKHPDQPNLLLYSREDESLEQHEIVLVSSSTAKVDQALSHSVKHYFHTAEELEFLLRSLSKKTLANKKTQPLEPKKAFQPKSKPAFTAKKVVDVSQSAGTALNRPAIPTPTANSTSYAPSRPSFANAPSPSSFASAPPTKMSGFRPKGIWVGLMAVLVLLLAAFLTNPGLEKHRSAVAKSSHQELLQSSLLSFSESSSPNELNSTLVSTGESQFSSPVQRQDFYLFSLTELQFPDYEKIVGVGLFGMVFIDEPETVSTGQDYFSESSAEPAVDQTKLAEMKRAVIVAVMDKFYADAENQEDYTYKFVFHNRSNRNITSFQGHVVFSDSEGELVKTLPLTYDRPLGIGERAVFHIVEDPASSEGENEALVSADLSDLSIEWQPSELLFKDGSSMSL
ncbi:hypothetical protein [Tunicatimonas pelagia]|uniref:hypothetical protein n=1 Tax=Tunicatimonas pelagia TaxID=931531 RepID=UPI0026670A1A|nr:hypothetical protein [Tunicatimonas pelagia]WKN42827.1 hypothetical protein P0M28_27710 [Tunicatimonas pelagia]